MAILMLHRDNRSDRVRCAIICDFCKREISEGALAVACFPLVTQNTEIEGFIYHLHVVCQTEFCDQHPEYKWSEISIDEFLKLRDALNNFEFDYSEIIVGEEVDLRVLRGQWTQEEADEYWRKRRLGYNMGPDVYDRTLKRRKVTK